MLSELQKRERRTKKARERRQRMREHVDRLKKKQDEERNAENSALARMLRPLVTVTRTQEFEDWYRNRTSRAWDHEIVGSDPGAFIARLGMAGFAGIVDVHESVEAAARDLETTMRRKVAEAVSAWRVRLDRVRLATPPWFDAEKIREIEQRRDSFNRLYPQMAPWHIDHIIPIAGETVCGLHVHHNMRVIPRFLNCSKSNAFDEEMLDVKSSIV